MKEQPREMCSSVRRAALVVSCTVRRGARLMLCCLAALAGCSDGTPPEEGGRYIVRLQAPSGHSNGAAVIELLASGVDTVTAVSGSVYVNRFSGPGGERMRVVIVAETPGALQFAIELERGSRRPQATIVEVAGGDDQLRASLAGYSVSYGR